MPGLFSKIIDPRYPATAIGLEKGVATVVHLERGSEQTCRIRSAATIEIQDTLIRPNFDEQNIDNVPQLAAVLRELASSAGLLRQKQWSISLPEATTRTLVLTLEVQPQSASELQEVLRWKMERTFGVPVEELSISKEKLQKDVQGRDRYLAIGIRKAVLAEYEAVIGSLGRRAGLILPRHLGESRWLVRNGSVGDSLLLSASNDGFTAVILRDKHPLIVRTVKCNADEREDELFRLLLFYRDRSMIQDDISVHSLSRLMVIGEGLSKQRVGEIVEETTGTEVRPLSPEDLGLNMPGRELSFDAIAAPAGLATLAL